MWVWVKNTGYLKNLIGKKKNVPKTCGPRWGGIFLTHGHVFYFTFAIFCPSGLLGASTCAYDVASNIRRVRSGTVAPGSFTFSSKYLVTLGIQMPSKKVVWGVFRSLNTFSEGSWIPRVRRYLSLPRKATKTTSEGTWSPRA